MRKKFILMLAVACTLQMKAGVLSTCMDSTKIETKYCTKSLPFGSPSNEDAVAIGSLWSDNWFVGVSGGTNAFIGKPLGCEDLFGRIKPTFGLTFGKWITPSVGGRLYYQGMQFKDCNLAVQDYQHLHADFMWNVIGNIKRIQEALQLVGINNTFYNPYRLKSKADMMKDCDDDVNKSVILRQLYSKSCSCAKRGHNSHWDKPGDVIRNKKITHCGMCLPCLYRRVSLDIIGLDSAEYVGTDVMHGTKYNLNIHKQKRNHDFNALLYFIKNRMDANIIRRELVMNGIRSKQELDDYVSLALHSYQQVKDWIARKGTSEIKGKAGIV